MKQLFYLMIGCIIAMAARAQAPAQGQKPDSLHTIQLPGGVALQLVLIPAGSFTMVSPPDEWGRAADEGPQRRVTITRPFYLGRFEVTQAQWKAVMGSNPSPFRLQPNADSLPADMIAWHHAQAFVNGLNKLGLGRFRLPTEAEWEYACRAGTTTPYYWGSEGSQSAIARHGWGYSRAEGKSHPVGRLAPNAWGLYDMSGNVWEWCSDWFLPYNPADTTDPQGPAAGERKIYRGGSWYNEPEALRSANRHGHPPQGNGGINAGLRVVMEIMERL